MSTNEGGNVQLAASKSSHRLLPNGSYIPDSHSPDWDKVTETMSGWGYSFTKSAMCKFCPTPVVTQPSHCIRFLPIAPFNPLLPT